MSLQTPDKFKEPLSKLSKSGNGKNIRKRLSKTDVLVIDEISMVESDVLVRLDCLMREARHGWRPEKGDDPARSPHDAKLPFGGAQIVITGDFCQLPPVKPFKQCLYCGGDELKGWARNDGGTLRCDKCKREYEGTRSNGSGLSPVQTLVDLYQTKTNGRLRARAGLAVTSLMSSFRRSIARATPASSICFRLVGTRNHCLHPRKLCCLLRNLIRKPL